VVATTLVVKSDDTSRWPRVNIECGYGY
jgi:hypothetical protein